MYFFLIYFLLVFFCLSPHSFIMFTKSRFILVNLIISLPPCFYWYFIVRTFWSFLQRTWLKMFFIESLFQMLFQKTFQKGSLKESFSNMYCMTKKHEDMKGEGCSAHRPYIGWNHLAYMDRHGGWTDGREHSQRGWDALLWGGSSAAATARTCSARQGAGAAPTAKGINTGKGRTRFHFPNLTNNTSPINDHDP